jgi:hypothetical protein
MAFSGHTPSCDRVRLPSNPIFHHAGIPGHLFGAKPNVSDLAQKTRFLMLDLKKGCRFFLHLIQIVTWMKKRLRPM